MSYNDKILDISSVSFSYMYISNCLFQVFLSVFPYTANSSNPTSSIYTLTLFLVNWFTTAATKRHLAIATNPICQA